MRGDGGRETREKTEGRDGRREIGIGWRRERQREKEEGRRMGIKKEEKKIMYRTKEGENIDRIATLINGDNEGKTGERREEKKRQQEGRKKEGREREREEGNGRYTDLRIRQCIKTPMYSNLISCGGERPPRLPCDAKAVTLLSLTLT